MLKLILGRAGFGKSRRIRELIEQTGKDSGGQILIVPEQFSFETERAAAEFKGKSESFEVLSFSRLCDIVFKTYGGVCTESIDDAGRMIFMSAAAEQLSDKLTVYKKIMKHPDFIKSMVSTVKEFKNCSVSPELLKTVSAVITDGSLKKRLSEIALLYEGYDALINKNFSDPLDNISRACTLLDGKDFFRKKTVFIDAFKGFTEQQLNLIKRIIISADRVYITLPCDRPGLRDPDIFFSVRKTARQLMKMCEEQNVAYEQPEILSQNRRHSPVLKAMESVVFAGEEGEIPENNGCITVYSADRKYDEVDFAASEISRLVRNEGFRYREISVIAKNADEYSTAIETVFSRHGIPFFLDARRPVSGLPLMLSAKSALEVVLTGYSTEKILSCLKCGIGPLCDEEIFELEDYCFLWKIERRDWKSPFFKNPRGMEQEFTDSDKQTLRHLNDLRKRAVEPFLKLESELSKAASFKDCCAALFGFFENGNTAKRLQKLSESFRLDGDAETADLNERSWDAFVSALDRIALLCGQNPADVKSFYSLFSNLLSLLDMGSAPKGMDQVGVGSAARMRPSAPRAVFILGANDGVFPGLSSSGGLLSDLDRAKLLKAKLPVADRSAKGLCEEGFLFYTAACAPSERLFISYVSGTDGFPSPPVLQIENTFGITPLNSESREKIIDCEYSAFESLCKSYRLGGAKSGALNKFFKEQNPSRLNSLEAFLNRFDTDISEQSALRLFSEHIKVSPTSVENYHRCGFMYLCRAGLGARLKKPVEIDSQSRGTLIHHVFEKMFLKFGSKGLSALSDEQMKDEVNGLVYDFMKTRMGCDKIEGSLEYSLENTELLLCMIIAHMAREMSDGKFVTLRCELPIGRGTDDSIPAFSVPLEKGRDVSVNGVVDRLDVYEDGGKLYFRVVDYKTGKKSFLPDELKYGLGLQMLIYLFAAQDYFSKAGKTAVPAGVLYMPAREAGISDGQSADDLDKQLRMKGIVLDDEKIIEAMDPGRTGRYIPVSFSTSKSGFGNILSSSYSSIASEKFFKKTKEQITEILAQMGEDILCGKFPADPLDSDGNSGCKYCDYSSVCPHSGQTVHRSVPKLSVKQRKIILQGGEPDEQ